MSSAETSGFAQLGTLSRADINVVVPYFLVEAMVLSVTGGMAGIGLRLAVAQIAANKLGWPMVYRP